MRDLGANGNVERGDRLITDRDELLPELEHRARARSECACGTDRRRIHAAAVPTTSVGSSPTALSTSWTSRSRFSGSFRFLRSPAARQRCRRCPAGRGQRGDRICWKINCTRRRIWRERIALHRREIVTVEQDPAPRSAGATAAPPGPASIFRNRIRRPDRASRRGQSARTRRKQHERSWRRRDIPRPNHGRRRAAVHLTPPTPACCRRDPRRLPPHALRSVRTSVLMFTIISASVE